MTSIQASANTHKARLSLPVRGVNLGNWLVLERWMGDSPLAIADVPDDRQLIKEVDESTRYASLEAHYAGYITKGDFAFLEQAGVNLVRIPVPYHLFGSAHHPCCVKHLDNAFDWAQSHGMGVLVDLHTVPLGQNGFDNGGYAGLCAWHRDSARIDYVLDVLERIALRYAGHAALWGIEPLNEPASWPVLAASLARYGGQGVQGTCGVWRALARARQALRSRAISLRQLKRFYARFYRRVRPIVGPDVQLVFHDRFDLGAWDQWQPTADAAADKCIWIDTHQYVCFADGRFAHHSLSEYLRQAQHMGKAVARAARHHRVLVGEWSLGNHARDLAYLSEKGKRAWYQAFSHAQLEAWNAGGGCCFWSLRMASKRRANWSFEECVRRGWLELGA